MAPARTVPVVAGCGACVRRCRHWCPRVRRHVTDFNQTHVTCQPPKSVKSPELVSSSSRFSPVPQVPAPNDDDALTLVLPPRPQPRIGDIPPADATRAPFARHLPTSPLALVLTLTLNLASATRHQQTRRARYPLTLPGLPLALALNLALAARHQQTRLARRVACHPLVSLSTTRHRHARLPSWRGRRPRPLAHLSPASNCVRMPHEPHRRRR